MIVSFQFDDGQRLEKQDLDWAKWRDMWSSGWYNGKRVRVVEILTDDGKDLVESLDFPQ